MDPYKMRSIIVFDLFCNTIIVAMKYIDTICLETYSFWAFWSFSKQPPIIKGSIITLVRLSFLDPSTTLSKEMKT